MNIKLKPKEKLFCFYYHKLRNCKEAYLKAGYPNVMVNSFAAKLLQRREVAQQIEAYEKENGNRELEAEVVSGLRRLAFGQISDCVKLNICQKEALLDQIDEMDLFQISEIKVPKDSAIEIKFFDRFKALEKLYEISKLNSNTEVNEFYQALEKGANKISQAGGFDGI